MYKKNIVNWQVQNRPLQKIFSLLLNIQLEHIKKYNTRLIASFVLVLKWLDRLKGKFDTFVFESTFVRPYAVMLNSIIKVKLS